MQQPEGAASTADQKFEQRIRNLELRKLTRDAVWKVQGYGLILITFLSFFPRWFHREEYLFFALLLIALVAAWLESRAIWTRTPIDLPLWLFVGWVLLTIPFATDPAYSFAEWRKLATQFLVFYWALLVLRVQCNGTVRQAILAAVVVGTAALSAFALFDFVERGGTWKDRYVRAGAPSSDYNWLSTYMVVAIPMLIAAGIAFRARWQRLASAGAVGLALVAQAISYTRAGWLGLVAQGLAFGLLTGRRRLAMWVLGCCLVIGVGLVAVSKMGYHRDTVDPWTLNARLSFWQQGFHQIMQHPIVGLGYGNNTFTPVVTGLPTGDSPMGLHSTFLIVGVGSGFPALVLLIWVLVGAVRTLLIGGAAKASDGPEYALMVGTAIMVVGFAVRNVFDYMFAGSLAYLFWILMATGLHEGSERRTIHN